MPRFGRAAQTEHNAAAAADAEGQAAEGQIRHEQTALETGPGADLGRHATLTRQKAEEVREQAAVQRQEAQDELDEIQRQIDGLQAKAKSVATAAGAELAAKGRDADALDDWATLAEDGDRRTAQAAEADALAASLAEERDQMIAEVKNIGIDLADLAAERQHLDGRLDAVRDSGNLDAITAIKTRLSAVDDQEAWLQSRLPSPARRADAIGDGQTGELADALRAAEQHHAAVRHIENQLWPDSPQAQHDAALYELKGAIAGNLERIAQERQAAQQPQRQMVARTR